MKLFYTPGACSLAVHIALIEAQLAFELEKVDLRQKRTASGADFHSVSARGAVPVLILDDGSMLTEGVAILQYVGDLVPGSRLVPPCGSFERVRLVEWLGYISADIHKAFSPLFDATTAPENKAATRAKIAKRLEFTSTALAASDYLMGAHFCAADAYLFVILSWCAPTGISLAHWPTLVAYQKRVADRPAVRAARIAEGLVQA